MHFQVDPDRCPADVAVSGQFCSIFDTTKPRSGEYLACVAAPGGGPGLFRKFDGQTVEVHQRMEVNRTVMKASAVPSGVMVCRIDNLDTAPRPSPISIDVAVSMLPRNPGTPLAMLCYCPFSGT